MERGCSRQTVCVINRDEGHGATEALFAKQLSVLFFSLPASHLPGWGVSRWLRLKEHTDAAAQGGQEAWTLIFEVILIPRTSVALWQLRSPPAFIRQTLQKTTSDTSSSAMLAAFSRL